MNIEWKSLAQKDLFEIVSFVANQNPKAAYNVLQEIKEQVEMLAQYPQLGRHGRVPGTRELVIVRTSYLVPYQISGKKIRVLRVLHGARKWPQ